MSTYGQNAEQLGDVLMVNIDDCGDIIEEGGIIRMTKLYETMVYLCLFGGNEDDDGSESTEKNQWWGNEDEPWEEKLRGRFINLISTGKPITSASIRDIQDAAQSDLEDGLGDYARSVTVSVSASSPKRIDVKGIILFKAGDEFPFAYEVPV